MNLISKPKVKVGISFKLKIRGVIANTDFKKGQAIEACTLILIPIDQEQYLEKTLLKVFYFEWNKKYNAIALGYGSLYNHSYRPNAKLCFDFKNKLIKFKAKKNITKGEEITFHYFKNGKVDKEYLNFNKDII